MGATGEPTGRPGGSELARVVGSAYGLDDGREPTGRASEGRTLSRAERKALKRLAQRLGIPVATRFPSTFDHLLRREMGQRA
jgi:hypothetical protein